VRHTVRPGLGVLLAALALCACGSETKKLAPPPKVTNFALQSKLMGRQLYAVLVTPAGGGEGRPLLVFLHGYGAAPSDTLSPAFVMALRRLGDRAPVVLLPEGDTGWWHDRDEGPWGSYVLREAIPAALARSGADRDRVAIGGISMGGFGALDLGRIEPKRLRDRRPLARSLQARLGRHFVRIRQHRRLRPPRPDRGRAEAFAV
jgi:poly(3-hydroxybutyrate) depolymerase